MLPPESGTDFYRYRTDERKQQILAAATEVFAESGYEKASIARIAERCGLSQPGLLHHYPSKAELLIAVLAYRDGLAGQHVDIENPVSGLDVLTHIVEMFRAGTSQPELIKLFVKIVAEATAPDHPAHRWATERYYWTRKLYAAAFERDAAAGRLREGVDPETVARVLVAAMDGLQVQWLLEGDTFDVAGVFAGIIDGMIRTIRAD